MSAGFELGSLKYNALTLATRSAPCPPRIRVQLYSAHFENKVKVRIKISLPFVVAVVWYQFFLQ